MKNQHRNKTAACARILSAVLCLLVALSCVLSAAAAPQDDDTVTVPEAVLKANVERFVNWKKLD